MTTVLFACVHNAGRSQMAATFFNALADPTKARAISAGTEPADRVHPGVIAAMREAGHDLRGARPQRLTDALAAQADILVTMGCGDVCPAVPGLRRVEWQLRDPQALDRDGVRAVRDDIHRLVLDLIEAEGVGG